MLSLKIENGGHIDLMPMSILAFEEVPEGFLEGRPKARSTIFYNVGEGITSQILENNYEVVAAAVGTVKKGLIEINVLSGPSARRMTIPRDSITYREEILPPKEDEEIPEDAILPKTMIKSSIEAQVITLYTVETREELALL